MKAQVDSYIDLFSKYVGDSLVITNDSLDVKLYKVIEAMDKKAKRKLDVSIAMIPYSEETYNLPIEKKLLAALKSQLLKLGVKPWHIHYRILAYSRFNDGMCREFNNNCDVCISYSIEFD